LPEFHQPLMIKTFDRQCEKRLVGAGDEHGPTGMEFGDASINADLPLFPEQTGNAIVTNCRHSTNFLPLLWNSPPGCNVKHHSRNAHSAAVRFVRAFRGIPTEGAACR